MYKKPKVRRRVPKSDMERFDDDLDTLIDNLRFEIFNDLTLAQIDQGDEFVETLYNFAMDVKELLKEYPNIDEVNEDEA